MKCSNLSLRNQSDAHDVERYFTVIQSVRQATGFSSILSCAVRNQGTRLVHLILFSISFHSWCTESIQLSIKDLAALAESGCKRAASFLVLRLANDQIKGIDYQRLVGSDSSKLQRGVKILAKGIADLDCPMIKYDLALHYANANLTDKFISWLIASADVPEAQIKLNGI
jgi:hypothetical protein